MTGLRLLFLCAILAATLPAARAQGLAVSVVKNSTSDQAYDVVLENRTDQPLTVVAAHTRKSAHPTLKWTLESRYQNQKSSRVLTPYLVIEANFPSKEAALLVFPPEAAEHAGRWMTEQKETFTFAPGEKFVCEAVLPAEPTEVVVRYGETGETVRTATARWRKGKR